MVQCAATGSKPVDEATAESRPDGAARRLPGLSVFLPSHNEEGNVERVVAAFRAVLPRIARDYEIIVVDDGSRDRTGEIADRLAAADPHVRAIHHERNRGYGGAVISGLAAARQPWVMLCDGDGQFDAGDVVAMAAYAGDYDVIIGHRVRRADPITRRLNGRAWTILMRLLFGIRVRDVDCGFKLFRREFIEVDRLRARGAMISTELLARMAGRGAKIREVEVHHLPRRSGEQSGANVKVVMRAFRELWQLYGELKAQTRSGRQPD